VNDRAVGGAEAQLSGFTSAARTIAPRSALFRTIGLDRRAIFERRRPNVCLPARSTSACRSGSRPGARRGCGSLARTSVRDLRRRDSRGFHRARRSGFATLSARLVVWPMAATRWADVGGLPTLRGAPELSALACCSSLGADPETAVRCSTVLGRVGYLFPQVAGGSATDVRD